MSEKYKQYHVQGWIQITVSVNTLVHAESLEHAKQVIYEDIISGDFSDNYSISENNCDLSSVLCEDE